MLERSDEKLVSQYLKGDEKSLEILIKQYLRPIYSFVYRYVGNSQDAEDITQDTFIKAWRHLKRPVLSLSKGFNPKKGSFKTWLFTIAKNTAIDFLKKKKAVPFSEFENEEGENIITDTIADSSPLPQEIFERKEIGQMLVSATEKLSPKYRLVLFLRYNDHFTFREIAEVLGESINTVKSRHRRALIMLRKLLSES